MHGNLDVVDGRFVSGWAMSGSFGSPHCLIDILVDDILVDTVTADKYRSDLDKLGVNSGYCGFSARLPERFCDGEEHALRVCFHESGDVLPEGERSVRLRPVITGANINLAERSFSNLGSLNQSLTSQRGIFHAAPHVLMAVDSGAVNKVEIFAGSAFGFMDDKKSSAQKSGLFARSNIQFNCNIYFLIDLPYGRFVDPLEFCLSLGFEAKHDPSVSAFLTKLKEEDGEWVEHESIELCVGHSLNGHAVLRQWHLPKILTFCADITARYAIRIPLNKVKALAVTDLYFGVRQTLDLKVEAYRQPEDPVINGQKRLFASSIAAEDETLDRIAVERAIDRISMTPERAITSPSGQTVEVIVPVFNGANYVEQCVHAAKSNSPSCFLLTIVDDGSTPAQASRLDKLAARYEDCRLIRNERNLGYTVSINRAIRESSADFVVLLNSDTIPAVGWLEGLLRCAESEEKIGVVGPLSNAASWQSVPRIKDDEGGWAVNEIPNGYTINSFAAYIRSNTSPLYPKIPVINGFCFLIKRAVIKAIGLFDEDVFPRGYGEENDFCLRAADAGFQLAIADDVFVYHFKSKTFKGERKQLSANANELIRAKHGNDRIDQLGTDLAAFNGLDEMRALLAALTCSPDSDEADDQA